MDKERVKKLVRELIIEIGEDPTREGLKDTPRSCLLYTSDAADE